MCGVIDRIVSVIIRRYRAILLLCTSLALVSIGLLIRPGLPKDYRIEALVAANDAEYYRYRRFGEQFVSGEMALIVMDVGSSGTQQPGAFAPHLPGVQADRGRRVAAGRQRVPST